MKIFSYFQGFQEQKVNIVGRISLVFRHVNLEFSEFAASKKKAF